MTTPAAFEARVGAEKTELKTVRALQLERSRLIKPRGTNVHHDDR